MTSLEQPLAGPVRPLTRGPRHHFFGYFDVSPWNRAETHFLALETPFQDHMPARTEPATIGLVDLASGEYSPLTRTRAWNFQQGAMLHWLPSAPDDKIVFNDEHPDGYLAARVLDVHTGEEWWLPRPISGLFHAHDRAVSLNYARTGRNRKVVGYPSARDVGSGGPHPADDGVFVMDLHTGAVELVLSLDAIWQLHPHTREMPPEEFGGREFWVNHTVVAPDDQRVLFLGRYTTWLFRMLETAMFTANVDGSAPRCVVGYQQQVSHFGWLAPDRLVSTFHHDDGSGGKKRHVQFPDVAYNDPNQDYRVIAPATLTWDGHPTLAPGGRWLLTDCYPHGEPYRRVFLVDTSQPGSEPVVEVFKFFNPKPVTGKLRCDPHPRWSPSGRFFSFDAIHEDGTRQVYVAELAPELVTKSRA